MTDSLKKQSEHVKIMLMELKELGMTQDRIVEAINERRSADSERQFTKNNFRNWQTGKEMTRVKAEEIHKAFPQYSVDWLRGYSEYPNRQCEEKANARKDAFKHLTVGQCIERLAASRGFRAEGIGRFDPAEYGELVKDGWQPMTKLKSVEGVERIENGNGEVLELSDEQWSYFVDEIGGYIEMRLGQMFERGAW